jgi:hypothetical protein
MFLLRLFLMVFALCVNTSAWAWAEYGVSAGSAFHYLSSTNTFGSNLKLTGRPAPEFRPYTTITFNQDYDQLNLFLSGRQYTYETPSGASSIVHNSHYFLGGGFDYSSFSSWGHYHLGLDLFQRPLGMPVDSQTILLKKVIALSVPLEYSTKLIVLEKQLMRAGAYGAFALPWFENAVSGYRAGAFVEIERRGVTRFTLRGYYEVKAMDQATVHQDEVEIGFQLKVGFPGRKGLTPPPDERE